jgi:hypothetical protein
MNANSTLEKKYFDLHTVGIGYLNRAREVKVKRGQPFLAVSVGALDGASDNAVKAWFDVRVYGQEAQTVIRRLMPDIDAKKSVLIGFKIGDMYPDAFTYEKGEKAGQTGVSLKARLLRVAWAKVDGATVYVAPSEDERPKSLNLRTVGVGYVNRCHALKDDGRAVSLCALHGERGAVEKTYFDATVQDRNVRSVIDKFAPAVEAGKKVLIGFGLSGMSHETFVYKKGPKAGQTGVSLKTCLARIAWVKVEGELVHQENGEKEAENRSAAKAA